MTSTTEGRTATALIAGWRLTGIGLLQITFGLVRAIDAWFKWQPDFSTGIGGKAGLASAQRELERGVPAAPSAQASGR